MPPQGALLAVLQIEDVENDALLVTRALSRAGYDVQATRVMTAAEMRQALRERDFDVVLADYRLPTFSALDALAVLKQSTLDLPFIIVSGTIDEHQAVTALRAGAHDFITKANLARLAPAIERERREAEGRRRHRASQAELSETTARLQQVWENTSDAMALTDPQGIVIAANPAYYQLYGYAPEQTLGQSFAIVFPEEQRAALIEQYQRVFTSDEPPGRLEAVARRADGTERVIESSASFLTQDGQRTAMLSAIRDITARKQAEAQIRRQVDRLAALRAIDLAISGSLDLRLTLTLLLDQVVTHLAVDAADVLLLDAASQTLSYAAGRGFRSAQAELVGLRVGEGRAGRAALERRVVRQTGPSAPARRTGLLGQDAFVTYFGVPLIAKGQVLGVLELFHRAALQPDAEWLEFMDALAGQAAIAIENAVLFDGLQRSHQALTLAYDATIEGWSRALDLRDRETEGHSQRVTDVTLQLARSLGMNEAELMHVRRGALLHDMGKIGIPDHILLKPEPLSADEWVIMRQHPTFAYELLAPIVFLRPALDVPYCHHEKWDGSGYPRGLAGEQIPLAARLFAVVDVWDALCSNRPYRPAWPAERVLEHIQSLSGSHFEPRAVEGFLRLIRSAPTRSTEITRSP